jgi:hypothetical protein
VRVNQCPIPSYKDRVPVPWSALPISARPPPWRRCHPSARLTGEVPHVEALLDGLAGGRRR